MSAKPMEHPEVHDSRSGRIMVVSHCCLNQNAKVRGIAKYPGAIVPLMEVLLEAEVGVLQMPCPEMTYLGASRWGQVKDQYNSPMFRRHCQRLAKTIVDQVVEYRRASYQIAGFLMMDGSPVCGLEWTPQPSVPDVMWGGMTWYIPAQKNVRDRGVYCEILQAELGRREGLAGIPFVALAENEEIRAEEEALAAVRELL